MELMVAIFVSVFLQVTEIILHYGTIYADGDIPSAPSIHEFNRAVKESTFCGDRITAYDATGRIAVFRYEKSRPVKIVRNIGTPDAEGWFDSDRDGVFDRYYRGPAEVDVLTAEFLNVCGSAGEK